MYHSMRPNILLKQSKSSAVIIIESDIGDTGNQFSGVYGSMDTPAVGINSPVSGGEISENWGYGKSFMKFSITLTDGALVGHESSYCGGKSTTIEGGGIPNRLTVGSIHSVTDGGGAWST